MRGFPASFPNLPEKAPVRALCAHQQLNSDFNRVEMTNGGNIRHLILELVKGARQPPRESFRALANWIACREYSPRTGPTMGLAVEIASMMERGDGYDERC